MTALTFDEFAEDINFDNIEDYNEINEMFITGNEGGYHECTSDIAGDDKHLKNLIYHWARKRNVYFFFEARDKDSRIGFEALRKEVMSKLYYSTNANINEIRCCVCGDIRKLSYQIFANINDGGLICLVMSDLPQEDKSEEFIIEMKEVRPNLHFIVCENKLFGKYL